jgi:hypothetical protein
MAVAAEGSAPWREHGRYADRTALWENLKGDLLWGFDNMYNLHIVPEVEDSNYPFKGWFFGWAVKDCNPGYAGCDAIYAARAPKLTGPWEVYSGDQEGKPVWDTAMDPRRWVPVIAGGPHFFNNWHNGDPSVIRAKGGYYMAYSATGFNKDGIPYGKPGDTDSDISCVMGAFSRDGLHWETTREPILVYKPNIGQAPKEPGGYMHPRGLYHRPSLLREGGVYKIWCDSYDGEHFTMIHAENRGDFMDPDDWRIVRGMDEPLIQEFPNPDVVKIGDLYFAYADPGGYQGIGVDAAKAGKPSAQDLGERATGGDVAVTPAEADMWSRRKICEAVSLNGRDWVLLGYIERDPDRQANHVPEALVVEERDETWIYLNYGAQIPGNFRYDRIRMKRRRVTAEELSFYRELCRRASGPVRFEQAAAAEYGFIDLFDGKTLTGWDGDPRLWTVRDGSIIGSTDGRPIQQNSFLIHRKPYSNFILKLKVRLRNGNSGIQFRSTGLPGPGWVVAGYQADLSDAGDRSAWGNFYEERGRGRGVMRTPDEGWRTARSVVRSGDWNEYEILAQGNRIRLRLNGLTTIDATDDKASDGVIAFQLHAGEPMQVEFRDIRLKPL